MSENIIVQKDNPTKQINGVEPSKYMKLINSNKKILIIFIFIIIFILIIVNISSSNKVKQISSSDNIKEAYKPERTRTDPYDEYDLETEIDKLINKQEKYLSKINR